MHNDSIGIFDLLTLFSIGLQIEVYEQNRRQATTDDLMRELQTQDEKYFKQIIENQNKILSILSRLYDLSAE